jgi:hypothetical protein
MSQVFIAKFFPSFERLGCLEALNFSLMVGLILCVCGCRGGVVQKNTSTVIQTVLTPDARTLEAAPTLQPSPTPVHVSEKSQGVSLSMIFPLEDSELDSGQVLRVTVLLTNDEGLPMEKAAVEAEVYSPDGNVFARQSLVDKGLGRYLADPLTLPERGASGGWHVVVTTVGDNGKQAQVERAFEVIPSYSEAYQIKYGFWIKVPDFFNCHGGDQWFTDKLYEDGSGYVHMNNHCHGSGANIVWLDVRWQETAFPADEAATVAYVLTHHASFQQDHDHPEENLRVEQGVFQGQPAWYVSGKWKNIVSNTPQAGGPVEWVIFRCPDSDWLWTLVISTDSTQYMSGLRVLRETFECPLP